MSEIPSLNEAPLRKKTPPKASATETALRIVNFSPKKSIIIAVTNTGYKKCMVVAIPLGISPTVYDAVRKMLVDA